MCRFSTNTWVVETTRGDSALYSVMSQLRTARDMAINRRRSIQVQFVKPNEIRMTRFEIPSGTTTLDGSFLEGHVQFLMYPRCLGHARRVRE